MRGQSYNYKVIVGGLVPGEVADLSFSDSSEAADISEIVSI